jgi:hypothetical protein
MMAGFAAKVMPGALPPGMAELWQVELGRKACQ